ncbi:sigma-70 family RNA polymerase sigma factor [Clostridium cylindrosporum]|uniref:RNA polymerase sigma factor, sigma-70 family n=1 Tax=Clostridium cylindrosporum DSM 605 TaxID=1121307 RepID=A0A0J8DC02_CLOCY|nr:sigma-70 family RNA polymerase sigma factor [Clostridium cylindrosporum]KMT21808.1 RNA polymerase sigma factor, sigma-70 family [Clostridium cylindrosporum DSM 605]
MIFDDDNFIDGLRNRNEDALEYTIDRFTPIVTSVVGKVLECYGKETKEECISDVFVSVWWNIERFKGEGTVFKNWICAVARFKAIDYYRRFANKENVISINTTVSPDVLDEIITNEDRKEVVELLNILVPEDRKIFSMRFFLGMKVKEIALQLNLSEAIVSNRIYKGKERIKRCIEIEARKGQELEEVDVSEG